MSEDHTSTINCDAADEDILVVKDLSKKFCRNLKISLFYGVLDVAGELMGFRRTSRKLRSKEFWALQDINFVLHRGEALGLVGSNGAGKTTLLRIISGIIKPDTGSIQMKGRIAPLLAADVGFIPVLTGRENIYANMSVLGLLKHEIDERFEDVVAFAEISDALDAPVQSYSSGMKARLAFSCAIHVEPDILLIDEALAVGDTKFRTKCHNRLYQLNQNGTSFIMVSHNSNILSNICDSAIYISEGRLRMQSDVMSVIHLYEKDLFIDKKIINNLGYLSLPPQEVNSGLNVSSICFINRAGERLKSPITGQHVTLRIVFEAQKLLSDMSFIIKCEELSADGIVLFHINSRDEGICLEIDSVGTYELLIDLPYFGLEVGTYNMEITIRQKGIACLHKIKSFNFAVERKQAKSYRAKFYQPFKHSLKRIELSRSNMPAAKFKAQ